MLDNTFDSRCRKRQRRGPTWPGTAGRGAAAVAVGALLAAPVDAQVTYSIDYQGPTISLFDSAGGTPITEGDILAPALPFAPVPMTPRIVISGGVAPPGLGLPLHAGAVGHPPGVPGNIEVDALSYGKDTLVDPLGTVFPITWVFSVDEFAWGLQPPPPIPPNVSTEGASTFPAVPPPGQEASADLFSFFPPGAIPPGIYPQPAPFAFPPGDIDLMDGDGWGPLPAPLWLNLLEPNIPAPGPFDGGDNLDAVDIDTAGGAPMFPVYYSLDANGAVFDFIEGIFGSSSAILNGPFSGADILVTPAPGAAPMVWAPAPMLGLDTFGPDSDDVDALILWDNGNGVYDPPTGPYSWFAAAPTDMVFFSVRRGSAIIGTPDFFFGVQITEGDILMPPPAPGLPPGIWVHAETLGLCTFRPAVGPTCPPAPWGIVSDDLNALDVAPDCDDDGIPDVIAIMSGISQDCNNNGIPDSCDLASGTSLDCQPNGIPDECDIDPTDPDGNGSVSPDCNCNGVPDECDLASGCLHDADGDGIPDECECPADTNCDGQVDVTDLLRVLADWGACP